MKKGAQVWLSCKVSAGMFSNESAVEISQPSGEKLSLYVDNKLIRGNGEHAKLLVYLAESSDTGTTVLLPSDSFQGSRWARVLKSELEAA